MILFQVLLSFVIAGTVIALLTLLAERFGSRVGGLIVNLPSNILITLIFITVTQGVTFMQGMVPAIPVGMLIDTFFLVVFIALLRVNLLVSILGSLGCWAALAFLANRIRLESLEYNVLIYMGVTILVYLFVEFSWKIPAVGKSDKRYTTRQMAVRAIFAGGIVGSVVLLSHYVPAYLTGIVSTFPAVLFSTMVILAIARGKAFARATGKIMIISSTNIVIYALGVYYTYPLLGIVAGTILSFMAAFLWILGMRGVMARIRPQTP